MNVACGAEWVTGRRGSYSESPSKKSSLVNKSGRICVLNFVECIFIGNLSDISEDSTLRAIGAALADLNIALDHIYLTQRRTKSLDWHFDNFKIFLDE